MLMIILYSIVSVLSSTATKCLTWYIYSLKHIRDVNFNILYNIDDQLDILSWLGLSMLVIGLTYYFFSALFSNFYEKHKLHFFKNKKLTVYGIIDFLKKIGKKLIFKFFFIIVLTFGIRLILRLGITHIDPFFNFDLDIRLKSFIIFLWVMPFTYYIKNIIVKLTLKKIKKKYFYLLNDNVVNNITLYNVVIIGVISIVGDDYLFYYCLFITIFISLFCFDYLYKLISGSGKENDNLSHYDHFEGPPRLKSGLTIVFAEKSIKALGAMLITEGFYENKDEFNDLVKEFKKNYNQNIIINEELGTFNCVNKNYFYPSSLNYKQGLTREMGSAFISHENSLLKRSISDKFILDKWLIKNNVNKVKEDIIVEPQAFFSNVKEQYAGYFFYCGIYPSETTAKKLLFFNLVYPSNRNGHFRCINTYYAPKHREIMALRGHNRDTLAGISKSLKINIPVDELSNVNHIIVRTSTFFDDPSRENSFFKLWRPSVNYALNLSWIEIMACDHYRWHVSFSGNLLNTTDVCNFQQTIKNMEDHWSSRSSQYVNLKSHVKDQFLGLFIRLMYEHVVFSSWTNNDSSKLKYHNIVDPTGGLNEKESWVSRIKHNPFNQSYYFFGVSHTLSDKSLFFLVNPPQEKYSYRHPLQLDLEYCRKKFLSEYVTFHNNNPSLVREKTFGIIFNKFIMEFVKLEKRPTEGETTFGYQFYSLHDNNYRHIRNSKKDNFKDIYHLLKDEETLKQFLNKVIYK